MNSRAGPDMKPRKSGRPSRGEADRLTAHVVASAARLFIKYGYAGVSIEAVAAEAGAGKNTIYRRYASKSDLFQAVVDQQMLAVLPPPDSVAADDDLMASLRQFAIALVKAALDPATTALQRLIIAEAERFPEVAAICLERAYRPAIAIARAVLERGSPPGTDAARLDFAAEQFVVSVVYGPNIHALHGHRKFESPEEIAAYVDQLLPLFMCGWQDGAPLSIS